MRSSQRSSQRTSIARQSDCYRTLGVSPSADRAQIKRAYRALAKLYHPDRVPANRRGWARKQMANLNVAYETLSDPQRRARYDRQLEDAERGAQSGMHSNRALWRAKRVRERWRRQQIERWRMALVLSALALTAGLVVTFLFARTLTGYLVSSTVSGCALLCFLVSIAMVNR